MAARKLEVTVVKCKDLRDTQVFGTQDPYVIVEYGGQKLRTRTDNDGGQHPKFNEKLTFSLGSSAGLSIKVMNDKLGKDKVIALGRVDIQRLFQYGEIEDRFPLATEDGKGSGQIELKIKSPELLYEIQHRQAGGAAVAAAAPSVAGPAAGAPPQADPRLEQIKAEQRDKAAKVFAKQASVIDASVAQLQSSEVVDSGIALFTEQHESFTGTFSRTNEALQEEWAFDVGSFVGKLKDEIDDDEDYADEINSFSHKVEGLAVERQAKVDEAAEAYRQALDEAAVVYTEALRAARASCGGKSKEAAEALKGDIYQKLQKKAEKKALKEYEEARAVAPVAAGAAVAGAAAAAAHQYPPPPQNYPPQGHPPQGQPPQPYSGQAHGYPPQGYPPQGYPPQGHQPQGYPPQGYPPQGYPPQGYPQQHYPPQGYSPQGYPPQGYPPQGYPPHGYPAPAYGHGSYPTSTVVVKQGGGYPHYKHKNKYKHGKHGKMGGEIAVGLLAGVAGALVLDEIFD